MLVSDKFYTTRVEHTCGVLSHALETCDHVATQIDTHVHTSLYESMYLCMNLSVAVKLWYVTLH